MKRVLIFEEKVTGHHLEYLHHLYMRAIQERNMQFIFVLPEQFEELKYKLDWPEAANIEIHILQNHEIDYCNKRLISRAWKGSLKVRELIKNFKANVFIAISICKYMPFLTLFIPRGVEVFGIIYEIYLYSWKTASFARKCFNLLCHYFYSRSKSFRKIFILNDRASAAYLNKKWHSNHYAFLPDPFSGRAELVETVARNDNMLTFFHFGGLVKRKGTLEILRAMKMLPVEELKKFRLIFAGYVRNEIREEFYSLVTSLKDDLEVEVHDDFVPYDTIERLCTISDYILIPYENTGQSSGVLAYAAKYSVPVVGPQQGMLGKIIRRYHLGICLESVKADALKKMFLSSAIFSPPIVHTNYLQINSVNNFQEHIFMYINENPEIELEKTESR